MEYSPHMPSPSTLRVPPGACHARLRRTKIEAQECVPCYAGGMPNVSWVPEVNHG
jgi:hypothetical protein